MTYAWNATYRNISNENATIDTVMEKYGSCIDFHVSLALVAPWLFIASLTAIGLSLKMNGSRRKILNTPNITQIQPAEEYMLIRNQPKTVKPASPKPENTD